MEVYKTNPILFGISPFPFFREQKSLERKRAHRDGRGSRWFGAKKIFLGTFPTVMSEEAYSDRHKYRFWPCFFLFAGVSEASCREIFVEVDPMPL